MSISGMGLKRRRGKHWAYQLGFFFFLKRIPFYNGEYVRFEFGAFFWCCAVLKEVLSGVYV